MNPEIVPTILQFLPYAGIIIAWFFKDKILHSLNVQLKKKEVKTAEKQIDTVYIENSERLVKIYQQSMDDLNQRNEKIIEGIKKHYKKQLEGIHTKYTEEREKDKLEWEKTLAAKKTLRETIELLKKEVENLTKEVARLTKQIAFYQEHTEIEIPDNLK